MRTWPALAVRRDVVRRALRTALLVGLVLTAINHGHALLEGGLETGRLVRIALTFLVPYCVSTSSSVAALSRSETISAADPTKEEAP